VAAIRPEQFEAAPVRTGLSKRGAVLLALSVWLAPCGSVFAAVLPEDRADVMYHVYDGGGVEVHGPALLVQKTLADKISINASYYVDNVSSASVDVVSTASPFKEQRTEYRAGIEYLDGNSSVTANLAHSDEPDYRADSVSLGVSHELFGGMSTVSLGYTSGKDEVLRSDSDFSDRIDRHQYRVGWSQVLTRALVVSMNYESVTEDGFLNSPYRSAILLGAYVPERYPRTRNSHALALRGKLALDEAEGKPISSLGMSTRFFRDSWDINALDFEFTYQRYFKGGWFKRDWLGEFSFRQYSQNAASFYSDNFQTEFVFMARDKELSTFVSRTLGAKATWQFRGANEDELRSTMSLAISRIYFDYDDFTDVRTGGLLSFEANVIHAYMTLWF
jgi:hypothetical protein